MLVRPSSRAQGDVDPCLLLRPPAVLPHAVSEHAATRLESWGLAGRGSAGQGTGVCLGR